MTIESPLPLIPISIVLVTSILILISRKRPNLREFWSFAGSILTFISVAVMVPTILNSQKIVYTLSTLAPGVSLNFRVDALSLIFGIVSSFLWIFATCYNIGYMRSLNEHAQTRYYMCFAIAILGAQGVSYSGSLLSLYLFYEIITIFTYPLVAHHQDEEGYAGAKKYIVYLMGTSKGLLLPAMVLTYIFTGTLDFADNITTGIFTKGTDGVWVTVTYCLFLFGFAKAAIMPLHNWLPSAMVAPTPVSALLHAVAVVKAGVFCISRVMLSVFGVELLRSLNLGLYTAYFVSFTILVASIIALTKDDLKARLAYSTVSQLSYIVLGVALLDPSGMLGGILHIVNHGFSKITLFFCAGAIFVATQKRKISDMEGIGYAMPFTMGAFAIASLSMIGAPPVAGFVTKWYLLNGALEIGNLPILIVLMASTILNAGYFAPITYKAFFQGRKGRWTRANIKEAPVTMVVPLVLAALISVALGIFPRFFTQLIGRFLS
ncbi:monovalent cation/H+ antiporter subunit D family protein [Syntrophorhabdus aromaticivorans]|jgi:multicomponent Na+:H+ antiporter subunit D|uniref:Monovalent cation/H+ antiporter subunit D family protein n=1 Tax=Syntrophorhabdus aromaticivorans TaxID=328301 RepID=A0A351U7E3_9BACT|nr:monovalent cation/H+ antiporter subunit D family protein [Syntrophorhabdus aromaticivorans]NLW36443.1 monovalent cation/H+ antiporter subunit D family protein [Syntrophorhabdus aromaticivorans]HBA55874.1 monovalent cation/H+ antiporter subunit D family protein [Syntrophorhabdus aromaticivorans]